MKITSIMFDPLWLHKTPIHWLLFSFGVGLEGAAGFLLLSNAAKFFLNSKIVRNSTTATLDFSLHLFALCTSAVVVGFCVCGEPDLGPGL